MPHDSYATVAVVFSICKPKFMPWARAMKTEQALQRMSEVIRRKHLAWRTEQSYCAWLKRYCDFIVQIPAPLPSEQKLERYLTALAKDAVAASTRNQAFNAILLLQAGR